MSMDEKKVEKAAKAMMRDLCKKPKQGGAHGCLLMFWPKCPDNVCVRGHIDLYALARAAIKATEHR